MQRTFVPICLALGFFAPRLASAQAAEPPTQHERVCFSQNETREKIAANGLVEPLRLMRGAANRLGADAISARLCQRGQILVYDISLLKHDGHVVHVVLNARDGQPWPPRDEHRGE